MKVQTRDIHSLRWSNHFIFIFDAQKEVKWDPVLALQESNARPSQKLVDVEQYKMLLQTKNEINNYRNSIGIWNRWSRLVNPFEKIGVFSTLNSKVSISRAFFKLVEILHLVDCSFKTSLHCCEAPGGFISASLYLNPDLEWRAQTLYSGNALKVDPRLDVKRWIRNGDGNICLSDNLTKLRSMLGKKVDLVTADGGFDVSTNPNYQEQLSQKLILGEIIAALMCQAPGGVFVCKVFDIHTKPTLQFIVLLRKYYSKVIIIKPRTSRVTNSEKYIVAKGFKEVPEEDIKTLLGFLQLWDKQPNRYVKDIGIDLHPRDMRKVKKYNTYMAKKQTKSIQMTLKYIHLNIKKSANMFETLQNKRARSFCHAFQLLQREKKCSHSSENCHPLRNYSIPNLFYCDTCMIFFERLN